MGPLITQPSRELNVPKLSFFSVFSYLHCGVAPGLDVVPGLEVHAHDTVGGHAQQLLLLLSMEPTQVTEVYHTMQFNVQQGLGTNT